MGIGLPAITSLLAQARRAHHIDLNFYDEFYKPGAYLKTHANHMVRWHSGKKM